MAKKNKQKNKSSNGNNMGNNASQSTTTQRPNSINTDADGFPPNLLNKFKNHQHQNSNDDASSALETLVPNAVYVARHALSSKECAEWIKYAEEGSRWDEVSHPATKWIAHRECGRIQRNDWSMSHRLYQRIEQIVHQISPQLDIFDKASLLSNEVKSRTICQSDNLPKYQAVSCNSNLRLYKYTKGQWFGRHVDGSNKIDFPSSSNNTSAPFTAGEVKEAQTEITVLFYLSSCRGGATRFHLAHGSGKRRKKGGNSSDGIAFAPEEGAVLLHAHGDHCLEHEAEPVLEGVKYVLRTDIVYGIM